MPTIQPGIVPPTGIARGLRTNGLGTQVPMPLRPQQRVMGSWYGGTSITPGGPLETAPIPGHTLNTAVSARIPRTWDRGNATRQRARRVLTLGDSLVEANTPQSTALGNFQTGQATANPGAVLAQMTNPLFGRPGVTYFQTAAARIGPVAKLGPGTGNSFARRDTGFIPTGFNTGQYIDVKTFDYLPMHDPDRNLNQGTSALPTIPRSIQYGVDGLQSLNPTYVAHDFTPADRFFKQGRSAAMWCSTSFGPLYRQLQNSQYQYAVGKYPLVNRVQLAPPLSPQAYFLGYQTQGAISAQIGGNAQARPLGYGS